MSQLKQLKSPLVVIAAAITTASVVISAGRSVAQASEVTALAAPAATTSVVEGAELTQFQDSATESDVSVTSVSDLDDSSPSEQMEQVTSVSQLSDVQPTDWAFQALQSLVERYGCIAGYPDGTYRGNRALTRYEFAAGLNACLDRVNELIAAGTADLVTKEDLAALQRLQEEFAAELATLRGRVDALEARTAELEANQFSTTTKLTGEAIFAIRDDFTNTLDRAINAGASTNYQGLLADIRGLRGRNVFTAIDGLANREAIFGYRLRLNLNTSFTGRDLLVTRLDAYNLPRQRFSLTNDQGALSPDETTGDTNDPSGYFGTLPNGRTNDSAVRLNFLSYSLPIGERLKVQIIGTGGKLDDFAPSLNALDYGGAGLGSISELGQRSAIYRLSGAGAGVGVDYKFNDVLRLSVGYLGGERRSAANPLAGNGLFNGSFGAIAQLTVSPADNFDFGLTYVRSYFTTEDVLVARPGLSGGVGTHHSGAPLGAGPMSLNSYGLELTYRATPRFIVSGWAYVSDVTAEASTFAPLPPFDIIANAGEKATILGWALTLAFPDLFKQGSLGGIVFGQSPRATHSDGRWPTDLAASPGLRTYDFYNDPSFHIEAFYRYPISDNISITPGVVVITNPEYYSINPTIIMGTIRTTFSF